jgi:hypothetical protein
MVGSKSRFTQEEKIRGTEPSSIKSFFIIIHFLKTTNCATETLGISKSLLPH